MKRLLCRTLLASSAIYAGAVGIVSALPDAGLISFGQAEIRKAGAHTVITQTTDRAIVDWQRFNVGAGEQVDFSQPSASSAILNRVHDADASRIDGALTANGQVYITNPNGIVFGHGAQVDVGSLVATTADIADKDFMAGGALHFDKPGNPNATVANHGDISVKDGGLAALVAPNVENSGVIAAKSGTVALAAGDTAVVDFYGDNLLSVAVSNKAKQQSVINTGTLSAKDGGTVLMTTAQASSVIDSAINMDGIADASSSTEEGGVIFFGGQDTKITLSGNATAKATGKTGGGTIHIGGAYQGKGPTPTAKSATVASGASIDASGKGGEVVVWSDGHTQMDGYIKATGGKVETSGHTLGVRGIAEAEEWLLDPTNAVLANGAGANAAAGGTFSGQAAIDADTIQTALNNGTSVTIATDSGGGDAGDITLSDATIAKTAGGDAILTLKAANSILTTGTNRVTSTAGKLGFVLWADSDNSGAGAVNLTNTTITTNGGDFVAAGGLDNGANGGTASDTLPDNFAGGTAANVAGIVFDNSAITTGGGNITLRGKGSDTAGDFHFGAAIQGATILNAGSGAVNVTGTGGNTGTGKINHGIYMVKDASVTTTDGNVTFTGTGGNGAGTNYGILLEGSGTSVTSAQGAITLTGTGGDGGSNNRGIYLLSGGAVSSTDTGAVTLTGTGGNGTDSNYGIFFNGAGSKVTSKDGDITVIGTGRGTGDSNHGIYLGRDADVLSTGSADIALTGEAGAGTFSRDLVTSGATVTVGGGTATGDITLSLLSHSLSNALFQTTGNITLKPRIATESIGVSGGAGTLQVTDVVIALLQPGTALIIGDSVGGSGAVDVDDWNMGALGYATSIYGGTIDVNNSGSNATITGTYKGTSGQLNAGSGTITATTGFTSLNIQAAGGATLSAGYIGAPGASSQAMANLISIDGVSHPNLTPNAAYTFAGFTIGAGGSGGSGGGGSSSGGVTPPTTPAPLPPSLPGGDEGSTPNTPTPPATGGDSSGGGNAGSPPPQAGFSFTTLAELQGNAAQYDGSSAGNANTSVVTHDAFLLQTRSFTQSLLEYSEELLEMLGCSSGSADDSCQSL